MSVDIRRIKYDFGPDFLKLKTIGLTINFDVISDEPIKDLILIERHYMEDNLIREYEFSFGFCMPHSSNGTEFIYDLPKFSEE